MPGQVTTSFTKEKSVISARRAPIPVVTIREDLPEGLDGAGKIM